MKFEKYMDDYGFDNKSILIKDKKSFNKIADKNSETGFGILFDIIGFSFINEIYGETIGDKTLSLVGTILSKLKNIEIFKLDGDEFLLLVKNFNHENAHKKFKTIKKEINAIFYEKLIIDEHKIKINHKCVGGLLEYKTMLLNLNIHLKKIKEKKIDSFFIDGEKSSILDNNYINILNTLDFAVKNDLIYLEYQPIIDNKSKSINKYETLVRIKHKNKTIYPNDFINIAQKTNYYPLLTETIITLAFEKFYDEKEIEFSINLDILDIENEQTTAFIFTMLEDFPYPQNVVFELLEVNKVEKYKILIDFIEKVKFLNAKIALDDFGSGYSNFEVLSKIDFDFIKIDGSLIKNINNPKILSIVESIVFFAKVNNIKTIAEFVSSKEIYDKVLDLGIDYSQGWYFAKSDVCLIEETTWQIS